MKIQKNVTIITKHSFKRNLFLLPPVNFWFITLAQGIIFLDIFSEFSCFRYPNYNVTTPSIHAFIFLFLFQVRTFYKNCNGKASCNCAVAVKVDDDVIVIDRCSQVKGRKVAAKPIQTRAYINGQITPGFRVYQTGEEYRVSVEGRKCI